MSRMGDAAKRNEKHGQVWGGRGGAKGESLRKIKKRTCPHGNFEGSCSKCIYAINRQTRAKHRMKNAKKAQKKGKCSLFALILLGAVGSLGWGTVELVSRII